MEGRDGERKRITKRKIWKEKEGYGEREGERREKRERER